MRALWNDTKRVCLDESRKDDERFWVTLRHIGTHDDPLAYDRIVARWSRVDAEHTARIRRWVRELGEDAAEIVFGDSAKGKSFADIVAAVKQSDEKWSADFALMLRERVIAGVDGGEESLKRFYDVGGPRLLMVAAAKVREFQEVSEAQGEA
jgi:hypothetical protein